MSHPQILAATTLGVDPTKTRGYDARAILNAALIGAVSNDRASRTDPHNPRAADLDIAARQLSTNFANHTFAKRPWAKSAGPPGRSSAGGG